MMAQQQLVHIVNHYAEIADDCLLNISLLKSMDAANMILPFLHSHALELSAKCAILTLSQGVKIQQHHDIRKMYELIVDLDSSKDFLRFIPSTSSFDKYKTLYPSGDATTTTIPNSVEVFDEYELCYFIDNVANLKYGFSKDGKLVSVVAYARWGVMNSKFLKLFFACRGYYENLGLDKKIEEKSQKLFKKSLLKEFKNS